MHQLPPADHSHHLADLLAQLYRLETLVQSGDREEILRQALAMDWRAVADEFELVVARHYFGVEHYARRITHNILRPYLLLHDCRRLAYHLERLEAALDESPSLHADADQEVATTWREEVHKAALRRRPIRDMAPITTLNGLREAAAAKISLGRRLEGRHPAFAAGERVPYMDLAPEP